MNYRHALFTLLLLVVACSQIEVPEESPGKRSNAPAVDRNTQTTGGSTASNSSRRKYRELYNRFKSHHRNIFQYVTGNKLALRNAGEQSVEAIEQMYSFLTKSDQSRLEDLRDRYVDVWSDFDIRSPSVGERTRLENAGKQIKKEFNPSRVQLKPQTSGQDQGQTDGSSSETKSDQEGSITRDPSDTRKISVENPDRYRRLFQRWSELHEKFQNGLEASDPLLSSTFKSLEKTLKKMVEEVGSEKDKISNYYLSQYRLIFEQRDRLKGTPRKSDHLSFLKTQFTEEFALSASN